MEPFLDELALSLARALRGDFPEREATAAQLAELFLDAVSAALPLAEGGPADPALRHLEAIATQVDVFGWEAAPGWDEVLFRGLGVRTQLLPGPAVLDGLAGSREELLAELERRAREQAKRLVALGRQAAAAPNADALVAAHACTLRLVGTAAAASLLLLPEDLRAGELPPPARDALLVEMDARAASGSEFAAAQDEWLATLLAKNPEAAQHPSFRTFFAGLSQWLRTGLALRRFSDAARADELAPDPEAILGALGGFQPVRWQALRSGAPASWLLELAPAAAPTPPHARLARECDEALDLLGRLWTAERLSATGFGALAALFIARCASLLALWEELGGGAGAGG